MPLGYGWRRVGRNSRGEHWVCSGGRHHCREYLLVWGYGRSSICQRESWGAVCCEKLTCWSCSWRHRRPLLWVHDWWLCGGTWKVSIVSLPYIFLLIKQYKENCSEFWAIITFPCHRVGRNVAAGMTGGLAYMLDEDDTLMPKVCAHVNFEYTYFLWRKKSC